MSGQRKPMEREPTINDREVRALTQFLLLQLRAQCQKLLGCGKEFDEELRRIDPVYFGRDIFSLEVAHQTTNAKNVSLLLSHVLAIDGHVLWLQGKG